MGLNALYPYQYFPVSGSTGIIAYATLGLTKNKKCDTLLTEVIKWI